MLTLDHRYNAMGHKAAITYPDIAVAVEFAPNGFGYPTQAIRNYTDNTTDTFVKGGSLKATYHPNGMLHTFEYGNGVKHKTTLNSQLVPQCIQDLKRQRGSYLWYDPKCPEPQIQL